MHRRRTLTGGATILTAALAGCLQERIGSGDDGPGDDADGGTPGSDSGNGSSTGDDSDADGNDTDGSDTGGSENDSDGSDTHDGSASEIEDYEVSESVVEPDIEHASDMDTWGVFIVSRAFADDAFGAAEGEDADAVREFVEKTEFDAGETLLFVQAFAPQTCYDLRLDDEHHADDDGPHVHLAVTRTAPEDQACGEAITPVSFLARLSFDPDASGPRAVSVTVSGHRDQPEQLDLEAKQ